MQFDNIKASAEVKSSVTKLDQLLRLYQMCKKSDPLKKTLVQKKVHDLVAVLKQDPIYSKIEPFISKRVQTAMEDQKAPSKLQRQASSISTIKSQGLSQEKKFVSDASISGNNLSEESSRGKMQNKDSSQSLEEAKSPQQSSGSNFVVPSSVSGQSSSELSNDKSEENSFMLLLDNFHSLCHQFQGQVESMLAFNEDVFGTIRETEEKNIIYLFGVNNPEKKNVKKLYICTLMKFSIYEICNNQDTNGDNKYLKEFKMFENNLRSPMGLIMLGKSVDDILIEHVKFLADMKSPLGVIIMLESWKEKSGVFYEIGSETLKVARDLNRVEFDQKTADLRKEYEPKSRNLDKIEVVKDKFVITKNLTRVILSSVEPAQNAIQIETSNDCIKEEPNRFPYKLHTKYYVSPKSDFQVFFLDGQLIALKINYKEKEFEAFKKFVLEEAQSKGTFLLSTSVLKETSEIKKDFWRLLVQCKTRDPYFLINLSGITNKKTIILTLKDNVSDEQIVNAEPFLFKDLQKSTDIFNLIAVVNKQNYRQFQTESKVEVMDLTAKKK